MLVWWRYVAEAPISLICIGQVGAGASPFRHWPDWIASHVNVAAVRLPGRESRIDDPPLRSMHRAVGEIVDGLAAAGVRAPALFGHCSGALVAFESARRLASEGQEVARLLVASPPVVTLRDGRPSTGPCGTLRERLERLGGMDPAILASDELFTLLEPVLEADFALSDGYRFVQSPKLNTPISLILDRSWVREDAGALVAAWQAQTTRPVTVDAIEADHFFGGAAWQALAITVSRRLTSP